MATACERVDDLVKDYLLFRGFTTTTKALDHEMKHDKDKGLRADKIVEQMMAYVGSHDLQRLREYWSHLNQRFFSRLEQRYASSVRKLEVSILKLYVINAHQNNRQERVRDFFEKIGPELQNQLEFRDWFAFQFLPNPAENGTFALYFTRQWQETVQLSLHNFLQVILQAMPVPTLLSFDTDCKRIQALQEENESLKNQLKYGTAPDKKSQRMKSSLQSSIPQPLPDLIYDFSGLADASSEARPEAASERQKPSRRFNINLPTPLLKRNRQPTLPPQDTASSSGSHQQQQHQHSSHGNQSGNNSESGTGTQGNTGLTTGVSSAAAAHQQRVLERTQPMRPAETGGGGGGSGAVPRKKAPRELTCFPPYSSPRTEKSDPLPVQTSGLAGAPERPSQQGQGHGDKAAVGEEAGSATSGVDYGPVTSLQGLPEGSQCPFLVLSDDEYLEHQSAVCYSRFSLSGQHVASLDADGIVKVWTWSPQPSTTATVMSRAPFLSLDWASKSDRWLLLGNQSGQIRLFDTREIKTFREASVESPHLRVTYLSTCPSTMTFASCLASPASADSATVAGKLALWDLKTMKMERYLPIEPSPIAMSCCVHSGNGKLLLAGSLDGVIRLYDVSQRQCVKSWKAGHSSVQTLHFAPHEASFFSLGPLGMLQEWSLSQASRPMSQTRLRDEAPGSASGLGGDSGQLFSLNKDKTHMVCGMRNRGVICKIGDSQAKGMQRILDLSCHGDAVTTVDWSPCVDTPVCVTGAKDGRLKVATLLSQ